MTSSISHMVPCQTLERALKPINAICWKHEGAILNFRLMFGFYNKIRPNSGENDVVSGMGCCIP